jgi:hypothetical protein
LSRAFADPAVQPMPWSRWRRRRHRQRYKHSPSRIQAFAELTWSSRQS